MKKIVLLLSLIVALGSCSPKWVPLYDGSIVMRDVNHKYDKREMKLNNGHLYRVEDWNDYLKPFVFQFPKNARDSITYGLTCCWTKFDKFDKTIRFKPKQYISSIYSNSSYLALKGYLKNKKVIPHIEFKYRAYSWLFINKVRILTDNKQYSFKTTNVDRFPVGNKIYEYFSIPYDENKQLIVDIINSKEPIIRFIGDKGYDDFTIPPSMIADLTAIQNAITAIQNNQ